jgi:antitoxin component YwqK of YwqJK toxin-antitoxin module
VGAAASLTRRCALAAAAIVVVVGAPGARGERFEPSVACRDGLPAGAYELRDGAHRLRATGAFARGHRTGTFIFWNARGARLAVVPYDEDRKVGTVALWYTERGASTEGRRRLEAQYADDVRHGITRSWYENGRPRADIAYERGTLLQARAWQPNGIELPESGARELAARDAAAEDAQFAELESLVMSNVPACDNSPPYGERG